jgi:ribosomal protein S12 methylthiotransferase
LNHKNTLHLISLGCTKNLVDSEIMLSKLKDYTLIDDNKKADVIIVNTCGFIQSAKEESINTILNLDQNRKKDSILVMAGCLTQRYQEELKKELIEVDIFTGVGDYDKIDEILIKKQSRFSQKVFLQNQDTQRVVSGSTYHAYIKLSEGCNQKCSFCSIPSFKGKLLSRTLESIIKEIKHLIKKGYFDFTFISQDSSSYLRDHNIKNGLEKLIEEVERIKGIKSARILYLYPSTTTMELINKISKSKVFLNYFDMPLQHISSSLLKKMKRGKGVEKLHELMNSMKNIPNSFIRTTFIVGHPGETQKDFEELCEYVKKFQFDRANVFSYSKEEETTSYNMKNHILQKTIDERANILGDIITQTTKNSLNESINKTFEVVIDKPSNEHEYLLSARLLLWAPNIDGELYINENQTNEKLEFGKIYKAKITQLVENNLLATIIQ